MMQSRMRVGHPRGSIRCFVLAGLNVPPAPLSKEYCSKRSSLASVYKGLAKFSKDFRLAEVQSKDMKACHYIYGFTVFLFAINSSQSDKPSDLSQGVYCEGCIATVKELLKKVNKKTGESREVKVIEGMEDICNLQNFGSYEYSPPKTGQACKFLMENYDEDIENIFVVHTEDFEQKVCYELTGACKGVDRSKKEKEELEVKINDEKQTLHSGSPKDPQQFNVNIDEEGAAEKLVNQINMAVKDKNVNGGSDHGQDDDDDDGDDDNKINEDDDIDDANDEDIENLTDSLEDTKTEL